MGIVEKLKNIMSVADDEDYEVDDEEVDIIAKRVEKQQPLEKGDSHRRNNKVLNIHTTAQLQVVLVKPERFDDASSIADHLNEKRTIVLNLESTNKDVSRRLVDFLSGVAYANNGQIKRVANSTFIITPYNVDIMGDLLDELESSGVFF
jgi:cell division inhibitor SepF